MSLWWRHSFTSAFIEAFTAFKEHEIEHVCNTDRFNDKRDVINGRTTFNLAIHCVNGYSQYFYIIMDD